MDIKLFVCCHEPTEVPKHPLLVPLQVGSALAKEYFPGFLYDDTGDNISYKNRSYCELTGQYWAWKNVEANYYGFFHYRRYLYPRAEARRPYIIKREPTFQLLDQLGYDKFGLRGEITGSYLKHLGFREDIDYTPIGCPSMYAKGKILKQRQINISNESKIAFNLSSITPENIMQFAFCQMQNYKNHLFSQ